MRVLLAVFLTSCAASADRNGPPSSALEGLYAVELYAEAPGCTSLTEQPPPFSHFRLEVDRVFNEDALVLLPCSSASSCADADAIYLLDFDDFDASGQARETLFAGTTCTFRWIDTTISTGDDNVAVEISVFEVTGVDGIDLNDCLVQHDDWSGSMPCATMEQYTGTPVR